MTIEDLKRKLENICDEENIYLSGEEMDDFRDLLSECEAEDIRGSEGVVAAAPGMLMDNANAGYDGSDCSDCIACFIANTDVLSANVIKNVILPFS